MSKQLTAKKLLTYLQKLETNGVDLGNVAINYRHNRNSDVEKVSVIEEDLFDAKTNNVLESLVLITNNANV
jgi:hypothetical protein